MWTFSRKCTFIDDSWSSNLKNFTPRSVWLMITEKLSIQLYSTHWSPIQNIRENISPSAGGSFYLWACFGFQTVLWLFQASSLLCFLSLCFSRAVVEQKSGTLPEVRENRLTKFCRCSSEFQIWRVEAFWFPECQEMRKEKKWQADKKQCADTARQ